MAKPTKADPILNKATAYWAPLAGRLGLPDATLAELVEAYSEPHRRYHTLEHIVEMLLNIAHLIDRRGKFERRLARILRPTAYR